MRHMRTLLALLVVTGALAAPATALGPHPSTRSAGDESTVLLRRSAPPGERVFLLRRSAPPALPGTASAPAAPTRPSLGFKAPVADSTSPHVNVGIRIDWVDAGVGAGFALGVMALLGGVALVTRHLGRPATA